MIVLRIKEPPSLGSLHGEKPTDVDPSDSKTRGLRSKDPVNQCLVTAPRTPRGQRLGDAIGCMEFRSGTQRRPALAELAISDESEAFFERMAASGDFPVTTPSGRSEPRASCVPLGVTRSGCQLLPT